MVEVNGYDDTERKLEAIMSALSQVQTMVSNNQKTLSDNNQHLSNIASSNNTIAGYLGDMRDKLLNTVLGKEIVPVNVAQEMLKQQRDAYNSILKFFGIMFGAVAVALIGIKYFAPQLFQ
ncbi:hypothetical protein UFOVP591_22 [uncultured Caudovirales phage]|uniref:Uncharacterized protein n=1 Tax=uncultured Caudovirales phage TaxID=2100421 RepID=A0A6J5MZU7_9CAUD|nr:hypothetical protein UFOVP591_22 [uncultured Caudovirales phage]